MIKLFLSLMRQLDLNGKKVDFYILAMNWKIQIPSIIATPNIDGVYLTGHLPNTLAPHMAQRPCALHPSSSPPTWPPRIPQAGFGLGTSQVVPFPLDSCLACLLTFRFLHTFSWCLPAPAMLVFSIGFLNTASALAKRTSLSQKLQTIWGFILQRAGLNLMLCVQGRVCLHPIRWNGLISAYPLPAWDLPWGVHSLMGWAPGWEPDAARNHLASGVSKLIAVTENRPRGKSHYKAPERGRCPVPILISEEKPYVGKEPRGVLMKPLLGQPRCSLSLNEVLTIQLQATYPCHLGLLSSSSLWDKYLLFLHILFGVIWLNSWLLHLPLHFFSCILSLCPCLMFYSSISLLFSLVVPGSQCSSHIWVQVQSSWMLLSQDPQQGEGSLSPLFPGCQVLPPSLRSSIRRLDFLFLFCALSRETVIFFLTHLWSLDFIFLFWYH